MIVFLNDVEEGGETLFPLGERVACSSDWHPTGDGRELYGCAACCQADVPGTLRVRPKRGRAVLFFNHDPAGGVDRMSMHAGCPVVRGVKWIAQRWFRLKPYQNVRYAPDPRFDGLPPAPADSGAAWDGRAREISHKAPRIYLLENFLSLEESEHLLRLPHAALGPGTAAGEGVERWTLAPDLEASDPVVARVSQRLLRAALVPEAHG